jgi:predicted nucleic acid-binding protein
MKGASWLTDSLFFDTDCLSSFLWVKAEYILTALYSNRIIVPQVVYNELSNPGVPQLKARIDVLIAAGDATIHPMLTDTAEYDSFYKMTINPDEGYSIIGKGEAAAIAFASVSEGIVASNNLKDVALYVTELGLRHTTTGDILIEAFNKSIITENEGNNIWNGMLSKKRKIGATSFSEYLDKYGKI